ncbi:MAG: hypothetical protein ACRD0W_21270, partial [Acidimicrobiales bacterium]
VGARRQGRVDAAGPRRRGTGCPRHGAVHSVRGGRPPTFLEYMQDAGQRAWSRVKAASDEAADVFGDAEQLLERISSDDRLLWLLDTTVDAAARASTEQKARALGRALAEGALASDDARIDEAQFMARVLADVETIDVRVLANLSGLRDLHNEYVEARGHNEHVEAPGLVSLNPRQQMMADFSVRDMEGNPTYLRSDGLAFLTGLDPALMDGPLSVLRRHGLIADAVIDANEGTAWCITDLGDRLLDYLPGN